MKFESKFLESRRLYLRPLEETDARGPYPTWLNDELACRGNSHHVRPYTRRQAVQYINEVTQNPSCLVLAVVLKKGRRHIGNIALNHIHPLYRSAEFSVLLGDTGQWGRGYGLEAARLLF